MIQKDYILRMIEHLGEFLKRALLKKQAGNHEQALSTIESAFGNLLGFDSKLFDALSAEEIAELLGISKDKSTGSMKCIIAARLLKEKAEIQMHTEKNNYFTISLYRKALSLYLQGILNGYTELDMTSYYIDIKQIADTLGSSIPDELMFRMFSYYRRIEEYDKARDWLFRLKNAEYPGIKNTGIEFFRKLLTVDEIKLRNCGLTIDDAQQGLSAFNCDNLKG